MSIQTDYTFLIPIYKSNNSVVFRGVSRQTHQPVILKTLKADYSGQFELIRYKHEYEILRSINHKKIIKAYELKQYNTSLALVLEDVGAISLRYLSKKEPLEKLLMIFIAVAEALSVIHAARIIHKDINPSNIVFNSATEDLKLIDFGIATVLSKESSTFCHPNGLEGTLAYISPEQTGRTNRSIDYRADYYSLGVTMYELLTGQLPFVAEDPPEIVHCHLAVQAIPPHIKDPTIPVYLSEVVLKLMSKDPEDRYQSALGIKTDLESCLQQIQACGQILDLKVGSADKRDQFQIPSVLYAREKETQCLLDAFKRVQQGSVELVLVKGYSGVGKSALVNQIQASILQQRGFFISGKFDQLKRDIPYFALIQSFEMLVRFLLMESSDKLAFWRDQIIDKLKDNIEILVDLVPELDLVVNLQDPVSELELSSNSSDIQNRFNYVLQTFLNIFATPDHPMTIFLDDLQWSDLDFLRLLELMVIQSPHQGLLIVGAYRDNEVDTGHPLQITISRIEKQAAITFIQLEPLGISHLAEMIQATLRCSFASAEPLAYLVKQKTQGNPFFVIQILQSWYSDGLFKLDPMTGVWQWDLTEIEAASVTSNVIDLMIKKIETLPDETQNILKLAACFGNCFDLKEVSLVENLPLSTVVQNIWPAIQKGLIVSLSEDYKIPLLWNETEVEKLNPTFAPEYPESLPCKFLHDRVQQAAYLLIQEKEIKMIHLSIGWILFNMSSSDELEDRIFDIVNHLNSGEDLITEPSERNQLIQLNFLASKKAKQSGAFEIALRHLELALSWISENHWENDYDRTLALCLETIEVQYINTLFHKAEQLAEIILRHAKTIFEKCKVYQLQIQSLVAQLEMSAAIERGLDVFNSLGVPLDLTADKLIDEQKTITTLLQNTPVETLDTLPEMTDPYILAAIRVGLIMSAAALTGNPELYVLLMHRLVKLCLLYGNPPQAAGVYVFYGTILCAMQDLTTGYAFGQLALKLLEKFELRDFRSLVLHYCGGFTRHWKEHARNCIPMIEDSIRIGLETGDIEHASYSSSAFCLYSLFTGSNLGHVNQHYETYIQLVNRLEQQFVVYYMVNCRGIVKSLIYGYESECLFAAGSSEQEQEILSAWTSANAVWLLFSNYLAKTISYYYFKDYERAVDYAYKAAHYVASCSAYIVAVQHYFYYSLALLKQQDPNPDSTDHREQTLAIVNQNQLLIKKWADHCPENFQHKYDLIEAEKARVCQDYWEATNLYEKAIQGAAHYGWIHEQALAYERAGEFYLSLGRSQIAQVYLASALRCYLSWGAVAKAEALRADYADIELVSIQTQSSLTTTLIPQTSSRYSLDISSIMKASQIISEKINFADLLRQLIATVLENAGAQTGILLLPGKDPQDSSLWTIEATAQSDPCITVILNSISLKSSEANVESMLPLSLIQYVIRTQENIVIDDAIEQSNFGRDPYILEKQPKSILCIPILYQQQINGILYLENNLVSGAFTTERVEILKILSGQAAISIQNSRLYQTLETYNQALESKVIERTKELSQALQTLETTQDELIQSAKMAALGQLVAGVAHEVNTPIGCAVTAASSLGDATVEFATAIEQGSLKRSILNQYVDVATRSTEIVLLNLNRAHDLIQNFKQVAVDQTRWDKRSFKVKEYLDRTLSSLEPQFKGSQYKITITGEEVEIDSYPGAFSQIVTNLVLNSTLHAFEANEESHLSFELREQADKLSIIYSDNGKGIPPEHLPRIFDPFFTTARHRGGTGLGLHIVYNMVTQNLHGSIRCESRLGEGTSFFLEFPLTVSDSVI